MNHLSGIAPARTPARPPNDSILGAAGRAGTDWTRERLK